jgi:hypothetical protein
MPTKQYFSYFMARTSYIRGYLLWTKPTGWVGFNSAGSLKQHSTGIHVAPVGHIIPIPSQPIFALTLTP